MNTGRSIGTESSPPVSAQTREGIIANVAEEIRFGEGKLRGALYITDETVGLIVDRVLNDLGANYPLPKAVYGEESVFQGGE